MMAERTGRPEDKAEILDNLAKRQSLTSQTDAIVGEGIPTGKHLSKEDTAKVLKAQRERANLMAIGLFCLCVLFFMITIVKIGLWG